ncbi:transposase [Paraburkholderia sp. BR10936]|uniref:transposase n=1 Tax=Paraburkholderia sp. BR10936 TaxID=3236993 RepID=UPI0034D21558
MVVSVPGKSVWIWLTGQHLEARVADDVRRRPERSGGKHIAAAFDHSIIHRHRDARTRAAGAPPVQRSWSPRGLPHAIEPKATAGARSSVLDFGKNALIRASHARTVRGLHVVRAIEALVQQGDGKPTVIALEKASIHHSVDQATPDRLSIEHKTLLFNLPPYSPELDLIEIVGKYFNYHWRRFVTWIQESIDAELADLLNGYRTKLQANFS